MVLGLEAQCFLFLGSMKLFLKCYLNDLLFSKEFNEQLKYAFAVL